MAGLECRSDPETHTLHVPCLKEALGKQAHQIVSLGLSRPSPGSPDRLPSVFTLWIRESQAFSRVPRGRHLCTQLPCPAGLPTPTGLASPWALGGSWQGTLVGLWSGLYLRWPHSAHLILQPYLLKASLQFRFVFNSQLISRSKKTELPCIQDTPGSPLLTLHVGFRQGTALGCTVKPDWGRDRLRTPPCVTGPEIPLAGAEAENQEAASAPSSGA